MIGRRTVFMVVLWLRPPMAGAQTRTITLVALVLAPYPENVIYIFL